ncbi:MAG TPA: UDP-N-acetylmuramoyl-L-alanine--D-glutamate ligase [Candidatus Binataceae bacterium]|nr:UDP-N-acetylmuramoyl-L-alanine--D-glutamate ligase [Candidatus Binataceae bacterium]
MKLPDLARARVQILGLGREGLETYKFLRSEFPGMALGLADRLPAERLAPELQRAISPDRTVRTHFGDGYLESLGNYEVIIRSPGVPLITPAIQNAIRAGVRVTSHMEIFMANCAGVTIGVTGTKGKSTTASLIEAILRAGGLDAHLVGNIGVPPMSLLRMTTERSYLVIEMSSYQLDGIGRSPHVAVLLNIVPEHLDLHRGFENYVRAKQNITRFQERDDILIYNAAYPIPGEIADRSKARRFGFSLEGESGPGAFLESDSLVYRSESGGREVLMPAADVPLPGRFNLQNVLAAITAGRVLDVERQTVAAAVRAFKPLAYRLEPVGTFRGIAFYDDPLATIPEATIAALDALGPSVATVLLGGYDRGLDMGALADRIRRSEVGTMILFPPSGERIWEAVKQEYCGEARLPRSFFTTDMRTAVAFAYQSTPPGRLCLHSPASPSFGLFKDYVERGDLFKRYVRELGSEHS